MNEFKLCPNGHQYKADLPECPYCPKPNTMTSTDLGKTKVVPASGSLGDQTQLVSPASSSNLGRTQVVGSGAQPIAQGLGQTVHLRPQNGRKLVGWLVSFTLDPLGVDFKLFEGRNLIGSDPRCDIVVQDGTISGHHLTILYRMGTFKFKDELSTNGTFVNDQFQEEGSLNDGDVVRIGNTLFLFRAAR